MTRRVNVHDSDTASIADCHAETKPLRPGLPQGGTLKSAEKEAKLLEEQIYGGI